MAAHPLLKALKLAFKVALQGLEITRCVGSASMLLRGRIRRLRSLALFERVFDLLAEFDQLVARELTQVHRMLGSCSLDGFNSNLVEWTPTLRTR